MVLQEIDATMINRRALERFLEKRFGEEPYSFTLKEDEEGNHWVLDVPEYIPESEFEKELLEMGKKKHP